MSSVNLKCVQSYRVMASTYYLCTQDTLHCIGPNLCFCRNNNNSKHLSQNRQLFVFLILCLTNIYEKNGFSLNKK